MGPRAAVKAIVPPCHTKALNTQRWVRQTFPIARCCYWCCEVITKLHVSCYSSTAIKLSAIGVPRQSYGRLFPMVHGHGKILMRFAAAAAAAAAALNLGKTSGTLIDPTARFGCIMPDRQRARFLTENRCESGQGHLQVSFGALHAVCFIRDRL